MMNRKQFLMNKRKKNILYIINMSSTTGAAAAAGTGEAAGAGTGAAHTLQVIEEQIMLRKKALTLAEQHPQKFGDKVAALESELVGWEEEKQALESAETSQSQPAPAAAAYQAAAEPAEGAAVEPAPEPAEGAAPPAPAELELESAAADEGSGERSEAIAGQLIADYREVMMEKKVIQDLVLADPDYQKYTKEVEKLHAGARQSARDGNKEASIQQLRSKRVSTVGMNQASQRVQAPHQETIKSIKERLKIIQRKINAYGREWLAGCERLAFPQEECFTMLKQNDSLPNFAELIEIYLKMIGRKQGGGGKRKRKRKSKRKYTKRRKTQKRKKSSKQSSKKSKRRNFKKSNRKSKKKRRNKTKRR